MGLGTSIACICISILVLVFCLFVPLMNRQNFETDATNQGFSIAYVPSAGNYTIRINTNEQGLFNEAKALNTTIIYFNQQPLSPVYFFVKNGTVLWNDPD